MLDLLVFCFTWCATPEILLAGKIPCAEFAPSCKASDAEATEQCFDPTHRRTLRSVLRSMSGQGSKKR